LARTETTPAAAEPSPLARLDATPTLARQTLVYAVSGAIAPVIGIITLPILARVFTQSEYGLLELGMVLTTAALTVADLSLIAAAQRSFFDYPEEELEARRRVLSTALLVSTALTLLVALALVVFREPVSDFLFGTAEGRLVALVGATLVPLNTFRFATEAMRVRFQARHYLVTTAISTLLGTVLVVVFVAGLHYGVESIFVGSLIANGAAALYGLIVVRDTLFGGFSRRDLGIMLRYGVPLVPTTLLLWALALVDRVILARLADLDAVGQYAMALRLAGLLLLAVNAFHLALGPFLFSLYSNDPEVEKAARARTLVYLSFTLGLAALVLTLFAREVLAVVAPAFPDAYTAVGPLVFGTVGYAISSLLLTGISLARRTVFIPFFSALAAAINIGLNVALVPPFGFVGAAFGTGAGYLALALFSYWVGQRVYRTPYEPARALVILAAAAALAVCGVLRLEPVALTLALKAAAVGAFVGVVWASRAMTRAEFVELGRFLRGMVPLRRPANAPA
jgi:O-antigen/teichoic acid export membrane protein